MKRVIMTMITVGLFVCTSFAASAEGLKAGDVDPKTGKVIKYWAAPMDPTYIRNEPGKSPMGMDLIPVYQEEDGEKLSGSTIRIDPVTEQNMGVRTATVKRTALKKSIRALGTVTYDETKVYAVNLKFDGWIEKLYVDFLGESVRQGQALFKIYSPELVTAQEEYLLASAQARSLASSTYPSVRENANRLLNAARQRLQYWDLEERQIKQLEQRGQVRKDLTIYSPANGVVIKKDALAGHYVKAGMHQYEIADLSRVWVEVEVYEYELPYIKKGMVAAMELSYLPGRRFNGTVLFIYPFLNPETRTVKLRLVFDNKDGLLKPDMYANVYLESQVDAEALVIPQEAVIDSGLRKIVFLALGEGKFEPRPVTLGLEGENSTFQVLEGLKEGDTIVTSAQFMFDSESRLREAIQKMLEARNAKSAELSGDDLDMGDLRMDDSDLDMSNLKMDN
jgi:Cu(I)/Ag(I) efflux system membrane fusion protein/cobalt-zinc-cadmium efflux system membrane fusion protein